MGKLGRLRSLSQASCDLPGDSVLWPASTLLSHALQWQQRDLAGSRVPRQVPIYEKELKVFLLTNWCGQVLWSWHIWI